MCEKITDIHYHEDIDGYGVAMQHPFCDWFAESTFLRFAELHKYLQGRNGYGWHITELVIYDEPRELYNFVNYTKHEACLKKGCFSGDCWGCPDNAIMVLPPQSWCYVKYTPSNND